MERAGLAVAVAAAQVGAGYGRRVLVLAGPGNNGGDGYVAARHLLERGAAVEVRAFGDPKSEVSAHMASEARRAGIPIAALEEPEPADLIIDALFGVGFRGSLPKALQAWTATGADVVAVDVPSGLDAATGRVEGAAFEAVRTVTFQALKTGHLVEEGPDRCGRVDVVDIGLPLAEPDLWLCEETDAPRPERPRRAHKWSVGAVLVVGGSPGISGAALLAARSALLGGAGSVGIACPGQLQAWYETMSPGLLTFGLGKGERLSSSDLDDLLAAAGRFDVLAVGPGLGDEAGDLMAGLLERWEGPLVLDADGINALARPALLRRPGSTIVTPHEGEFARLTGWEANHHNAARLAKETDAVVLLKGNPTFVMGPRSPGWVITTGGPELASIGTGDVLTGLVAAFRSRGLGDLEAARSAAYWHGRAGSALASRGTVTAEALAEEVGRWSVGEGSPR